MMPTISLYQLPATELPRISTLSTMGDIPSADKHRNPPNLRVLPTSIRVPFGRGFFALMEAKEKGSWDML